MNSKIATMPIKNRFAELLEEKAHKEDRYISLAEVAIQTGIRRKTLYQWQKNEITQLNTKVIDKLCEYFGVSFTDLLEQVPDKQTKKVPR